MTSPRQYILREGSPLLLGAVPDSRGTNFAIFSAAATRVEVADSIGVHCGQQLSP